jgi:adenylate kinase family enzyme
VRRVVILGRGGAGKSVLARQLARLTGLPSTELDALFWQAGQEGAVAPQPAHWAAQQRELTQRDAWILDGDLGPYDFGLAGRLRTADTVIVLDFGFLRCAWRTIRRGRENAEYWQWVWAYRRRSLPRVMQAIAADAPQADVHVLRSPAMVRRFISGLPARPGPGQ